MVELYVKTPDFHGNTQGYSGVTELYELRAAIKAAAGAGKTSADTGGGKKSYDAEVRQKEDARQLNIEAAMRISKSAMHVEGDEYGDLRLVLRHEDTGQKIELPPKALALFYRGELGTENGRSILLESQLRAEDIIRDLRRGELKIEVGQNNFVSADDLANLIRINEVA